MSEDMRKKKQRALRTARTIIIGKKHEEETKRRISDSQPYAKKIQVIDLETNKVNIYSSIKAAAKALDIPQPSISRYFTKNQQSPYKGRYIFKKGSVPGGDGWGEAPR
jgi:group I intron endonuclease